MVNYSSKECYFFVLQEIAGIFRNLRKVELRLRSKHWIHFVRLFYCHIFDNCYCTVNRSSTFFLVLQLPPDLYLSSVITSTMGNAVAQLFVRRTWDPRRS